jgi:inorganic phosphate transporter, PiT family
MMLTGTFVIFIILIALVFDYTNGMHDAANSIATVVSTKVLTPKKAVIWAAFFNFIAFLIFGTEVAKTIGTGIIDINSVNPEVIFCGLLGAIIWNLVTWYFGLPSSSSHALIGGFIGAAVAKSGFGVVIVSGCVKIMIFLVLAPLLGMALSILFMIGVIWVVHKKPLPQINFWSKKMQLVSAALYSLGHGGNDAQKTMGIITSLLFSAGMIDSFYIPLWVVLLAQAAIGLGTLSGGWRIVKTMGQKICKLRPIDGFCAETASAVSIFLSTFLGIPVSTTHVITGAVTGVGTVWNISAVKWQVTLNIVWAWILTIPMAALCSALLYKVFVLIFR